MHRDGVIWSHNQDVILPRENPADSLSTMWADEKSMLWVKEQR